MLFRCAAKHDPNFYSPSLSLRRKNSTAAESTSSLYHSPNALGVLSQRATLVGLITKMLQANACHKTKQKQHPMGAVFCLARRTEKDITCQVDINNRYTCNNLCFADCIHRNYPQHFLLFHISYMLHCYQTNCTYLLLN